ncbi:MAG: lipopolysaccharide transport periplasmic protein LptA [Nitrincola lacisaponensis]|uniref:Lipopolysaccharide export system protein LptA n=1 Tax=Nitrincola lacisaponensis TaxID=267850 RepID=A0A063Y7P1_9GAMM|nr:lipopolysaccharide transport periplasmic protein LptA [Nitrincola lacisaponensis]KDE40776.1 LptA, protein essential for LPS transport across the periplasm [Nitrincola lacisaponensis]
MLHVKIRLISLASLLLFSMHTFALPDDQDQPIYVSADQASLNERTGVAVYTGAVEIRQGSMILQGSRVEMHRDGQGSISRIITTGSPAEFQQQASPNQPVTKAYGLRMDYQVPTQTVTITENARVVQDADEFTGERIVYDMDNSIVDAFRSEAQGGQRVQMVIQPKANP